MDKLLVVSVSRPTSKGTIPIICMTAGGVPIAGFASKGHAVKVGDQLSATVLNWDHSDGRFWVWLP